MTQGRNLNDGNPAIEGACQSHASATAAVSHNSPPAASGGDMDDLRQGVSGAAHAVLDRLEDAHGPMPRAEGFPILFLTDARKAVNAAMRADPQTGMGRRRRAQAIEAAVLLIRALECMDESGRTILAGSGE